MKSNVFINPPQLFNPSQDGFSHVGIAPRDGQLVFIAGQWASDTSQNLVSEDFSSQVKQSMVNLKTALEAVGLTEQNIIKLTIYVVNYSPEMKKQIFQAAAPLLNLKEFPVSTIVPVPVLAAHPKSLIEIEAIATR